MRDATERFGEGSSAVEPHPLSEQKPLSNLERVRVESVVSFGTDGDFCPAPAQRQKPDFNQIVVRDSESVCLNRRFRPIPTPPGQPLTVPISASTARRSGSASVGQARIRRARSGSISGESGKLDGKTRNPVDVTDCRFSVCGESTPVLKTGMSAMASRVRIPASPLETVEKTLFFSTVSSFVDLPDFPRAPCPQGECQPSCRC